MTPVWVPIILALIATINSDIMVIVLKKSGRAAGRVVTTPVRLVSPHKKKVAPPLIEPSPIETSEEPEDAND